MLITLDGVHFRGDMGRAMFTIEHGALNGWFEAPGVRRDATPRPTGDGVFTAPTYRAGRSVAWSGLVHSTSHAEQRRAFEQLAGMCSGRGLYRLTVQDGTDATWTDVHLLQAPDVTVLAAGRLARYDVEVFAPDPRRYGELRSFSAADRVYHRGNAPAFPVVTIPNAAAAYTLSSGGKSIVVSGAPAGATHVIDTRTGRLASSGTIAVGVVTRADSITIPPGIGQTVALSPAKAFTTTIADTFF